MSTQKYNLRSKGTVQPIAEIKTEKSSKVHTRKTKENEARENPRKNATKQRLARDTEGDHELQYRNALPTIIEAEKNQVEVN